MFASAIENQQEYSRFDSYSVRKSLLMIPHNTFWDCRVHILSNNLSQNTCIWKNTKVYTAFRFMGHAFCKEDIEDTVKLLESIVFCSLKITMADFHKIGLNMRERCLRKLSSKISQ